ncbi:MerR family transcriptional regulator [Kitasatospora sp. NPDC049285]|uniref:MerR family transcriptional regulator n=1 Tax=Kitasatospora sp. NPDC049285 TaxID=3157096 RepID=UPI0034355F5F
MRIGELSRVTGASARSLRHYEQQGILDSVRLPNGYRDYGPDAAEQVERIRALLALGLPTEAIRDLLPCEGPAGPEADRCPALADRIRDLRDRMDRQAAELARTSAALTRYLDANL